MSSLPLKMVAIQRYRHTIQLIIAGIPGLLIFHYAYPENNLTWYLKSEAGYETNILESRTAAENSLTWPVWSGLNFRYQGKRLLFNCDGTGGYITYQNHSLENKATLAINIQNNYQLNPTLFVNTTANFLDKWWYNRQNGYVNLDWHLNVGWCFQKITPTIGLYLSGNDYRQMDVFDNSKRGGQAEILLRINPRLMISTQVGYVQIDYLVRRIYDSTGQNIANQPLQKDRVSYFQIGFEYRRQAITGLRLKLLQAHSNNSFSVYSGVGLSCYLSKKIGRGYIQLIAESLLKKYTADLSQHFVDYNPDPEQNIQNQLLFGWERPLLKRVALTGKAAIMRNETHYCGYYYNKWFISCGLLYRNE